MPLVPIATFLTGSLLSLLLPTLLLIALGVWYVRFVARAPGPADASELAPDPSPGPNPTVEGTSVTITGDAPMRNDRAADQP